MLVSNHFNFTIFFASASKLEGGIKDEIHINYNNCNLRVQSSTAVYRRIFKKSFFIYVHNS